MKRVLITGENSYIGTNFKKWLAQYPQEYEVETISVRGDEWRKKDFSKFDVVYHVAGIAHIKETKANEQLYYQVNRDLTVAIAKKSKNEGINQFIFLSSMSVYGLDEGAITKDTRLNPKSAYGKSKMEAELLIKQIESKHFKVAIVRPPMVYGKDCTGNYAKLSKLAKLSFIFPKINNQRSMIYIENLSYVIQKIIDENRSGFCYPQNLDFVCTTQLVKRIGLIHNHKIYFSEFFGKVITTLPRNTLVNKVFGDLYYEFGKEEFLPFGFEDSLKLTEETQ